MLQNISTVKFWDIHDLYVMLQNILTNIYVRLQRVKIPVILQNIMPCLIFWCNNGDDNSNDNDDNNNHDINDDINDIGDVSDKNDNNNDGIADNSKNRNDHF